MENKRRLILALLFTGLCIAIGILLYVLFFRRPASQTPLEGRLPETTQPLGGFPQAGTSQGGRIPDQGSVLPTGGTVPIQGGAVSIAPSVQQIIEDGVTAPTVTDDGIVQYYDDINGQFYRVGKDGRPELLSDQIFYNVDSVVWSPNQHESIIEYPDGSNIYYNFETKRQVTLPKHWEEFSFAPKGDQIAAKSMAFSADNRWLVAANPDGSNVSLVERLGDNANKVIVDWSPNQQVVALSRTGQARGGDEEEILLVGLHGENYQSLTVDGRGIKSEWSPQGKKILYSVYSARSDYKPELWIVNAEGDKIGTGKKPLSINTWADKCTFSDERFVYCGVPQTLPTGAGFAPDVANDTPDLLYKIDLESGIKTGIELNESHVIDRIFLGPDGKSLYFTDKTSDGIFRVDA